MTRFVQTNIDSVTVEILRYPDNAMIASVAQGHGEIADKVLEGLCGIITSAHYLSDFFCVAAFAEGDVIGYASFIESSSEPGKWFYTDLWVAPKFRRRGIGRKIVRTGLSHLFDLDAKLLLCTVSPQNIPSQKLQHSLGFSPVPNEPFEFFETDGLLMFRRFVSGSYNMLPLTDDFYGLQFIVKLLCDPGTAAALHMRGIPREAREAFYEEMHEALFVHGAKDEQNYIIRKGVVPVGWLKLNGFTKEGMWISMLVVHEKYRCRGVGSFALDFAEKCARSTHRKHIYISTTADNMIALSLYQNAGYTVTAKENRTWDDQTKAVCVTLQKELS